MTTTTTTHPKIIKPTSGLIFSRGVWSAEIRIDGKRKYRSLGTEHLDEAITRRNALYRELGAVPREPTTRQTQRIARYVYWRKPYVASVQGVHLGAFETMREADAAVVKYLTPVE